MSKKRGLGRGLDALLASDTPAAPATADTVTELPIGDLEPNRYQPRSHFDPSALHSLTESIRAQGVVQPIVVMQKDDGGWAIIAGERRWRAAKEAGLRVVPVVVRKVRDDQQLLEMALVENVQRADLDPIEEAEAYRMLADSFALSQEDIAKRVGKARTTVTNALRLLRLPAEVQDYLRDGRLTPGQARPLLALGDAEQQCAVARRALEEGLTARDLEDLTASAPNPEGKEPPAKRRGTEPDVHTRAAVEKLTQTLQTRVEIQRRKRGGGIVRIHFHSEDELIRLYDRLTIEET